MKMQPALRDVRMAWVRGKIHKNGKAQREDQVCLSLQNKQLQWGNPPLTKDELYDIIYRDASRYTQRLAPDDILKKEFKELNIKEKTIEVEKLRTEYKVQSLGRKKRTEELETLKLHLMETSKPEMFNLEMYQRMKIEYCILAIQSEHPDLTDKQCKSVIGSWVRKGY